MIKIPDEVDRAYLEQTHEKDEGGSDVRLLISHLRPILRVSDLKGELQDSDSIAY